jgi:hypothetical protein
MPQTTWPSRARAYRARAGRKTIAWRSMFVIVLGGLVACGGGRPETPTSVAPTSPPVSTVPTPLPLVRPPEFSVDRFLATCPTAQEIRSIDADLMLIFDADPTRAEAPACSASLGSVDLTTFEKRVYQSLLVMRYIQFDAALPWTPLPLYDWLRTTVKGIRFSSEAANSYCCERGERIVIRTAASRAEDRSCLLAGDTTRWVAPDRICGMDAFIALVVHEARHNEGKPHTCTFNDRTIDEMGAWAANYYMFRWFAEHSGADLTPADGRPSQNYYRQRSHEGAQSICLRFCDQGCAGAFSREPSLFNGMSAPPEWQGCSPK